MTRKTAFQAVLVTAALLLGVLCWYSPAKSIEHSGDKSPSPSVGVEAEPGILDISHIPDGVLRSAALEMASVLSNYVVPESGDGNVEAAEAICLAARETFAYFERHQVRYGLASADRFRPSIANLFRDAMNKLNWVEERPTTDKNLSVIHQRIRNAYKILASGKPIKPAPLAQEGLPTTPPS